MFRFHLSEEGTEERHGDFVLGAGFPLAVALTQIRDTLTTLGYWSFDGVSNAATMAGCVLFVSPMLILYVLLQRKFIQSIDKIGITG